MEHHFGEAPDFALGIEEELLLVDELTLRPATSRSDLVARLEPEQGTITNDLYEALIETSTPVVRSAPEGVEHLASHRELLREQGAAFIGGGLHPDAAFGDVVHVDKERYEAIRDEMRGLVTRTPTGARPRPRRDAGPGDRDRRSTTACAPTCRCCRRWRRTRPSGTARTPASPAPAP